MDGEALRAVGSKGDRTYGVLVPAYNEGLTVARVVRECLRFNEMVLVVDDGSTDGTGDLASDAGAKVVRLASRSGLGAALRRGFEWLAELGVQTVVTLDGDGAHDPSQIPALLEFHAAVPDGLTIGSRFLAAGTVPELPSAKWAANVFATALVNEALGCSLSDVSSGMRVFGPTAMSLPFSSTDFSISFEFLAESLRHGLTIRESSIRVRYDAEELCCTSRRELLNLLSFVAGRSAAKPKLHKTVMGIRHAVEQYKVARVNANGRAIVLQPLPEYSAYLFQFQDEWFLDCRRGEEWLLVT